MRNGATEQMGTVFGHWRGKKEVREDEDTGAAPA